jgi:hypothetical protein
MKATHFACFNVLLFVIETIAASIAFEYIEEELLL